jgi:transposase
MQKDEITALVQISGFSVADISFWERKGQIPEVRIRLTRDKPCFCCSGCGQYYLTYYDCQTYEVRDLPYGKWKKAYLLFDKVRVECNRCGVKIEQLEWLEPYARLTKRFEEEVAQECRFLQSIRDVAKRCHLGWDAVKEIDKKYLDKELNPPDFKGVEEIAVDEIAIKKHHKYATVISEIKRRRVLWVEKNRDEKSLGRFYKKVGKDGCQAIRAVAMDMWTPYENATRKYCPEAEIVYDEFHIIQNYGKIIDRVRNMEFAKAKKEEQKVFKGTKYLLLSNRAKVRGKNRVRLDELLKVNQALTTVYLLKDDLKHLWDYTYEGWARKWFTGWYQRAQDSGIEPLIKFAGSLKEHLNGILAHCRYWIGTSFLEGMNNKIKVIKRIAFGFRDMEYFFLKIRGAFSS